MKPSDRTKAMEESRFNQVLRNGQFARHVEPYVKTLRCQICQGREWDAMARVGTPIVPEPPQSFSPGSVSLGLLVCRSCGFIHFFAWKKVEERLEQQQEMPRP